MTRSRPRLFTCFLLCRCRCLRVVVCGRVVGPEGREEGEGQEGGAQEEGREEEAVKR
jgi:hypothetical protein